MNNFWRSVYCIVTRVNNVCFKNAKRLDIKYSHQNIKYEVIDMLISLTVLSQCIIDQNVMF